MSAPEPQRTRVFISYSHQDKRWLDRLLKMLAPLRRREVIAAWADTQIQAGQKWREEITTALAETKVAVLLVSPDFLDSDFIAKHELPPLLEAAQNEGVTILWLSVSACLHEATDIAEYQCANDPSHPLDSLSRAEQNRVLRDVARQIQGAATKPLASPSRPAMNLSSTTTDLPPRNSFFTGREYILQRLHEELRTHGRAALSGLGGMGKTQTAIEYAHRHGSDYRLVFWVRAETRETLLSGLAVVAHRLNLPERNEQDQSVVVAAARRWLEGNGVWLLVLDNADDLPMAREFFPQADTFC